MSGGGGGGATTPQVTQQEMEYANVLQNILGASNAISAPVEKFAIQQMKALDTPLAYNSAGGLGLSHAIQQMEPMQQQALANAMASGAAPGSGRYLATQTGLSAANAAARVQGDVSGRLGNLDRRLGLMNAAVGVGRQRLGSALDTLSGLSDKANAWERKRAQAAQASASSGADWGQIAGMVGGAALGAMTGGAGLALTAAALGGGLGSGISNATR